MIDGIKMNISYVGTRHIKTLLKFEKSITRNGRGIPCEVASHHGIIFRITPTRQRPRIEAYGSIHKWYNSIKGDGEQNYNDFSTQQIDEAFNHFCKLFDLKPENVVLENVEYGVNVSIGKPAIGILNNCISWNYQTHIRKENYDRKGLFFQFAHSHNAKKSIKFYAKGNQYDKDENLIRIEVRLITSREISKVIHGDSRTPTVNDLLRHDTYLKLKKSLIAQVEKFIIVDDLKPPSGLNRPDQKTFLNGINPKFWEGIDRQKRYYHKRRFDKIISSTSLDSDKQQLMEAISEKWESLSKNCYKNHTVGSGPCIGGVLPILLNTVRKTITKTTNIRVVGVKIHDLQPSCIAPLRVRQRPVA